MKTLWQRLPALLILGFLIPACAPGELAPPGDYSNWNWPLTQKNSAGALVARSYLVHIPPQAAWHVPLPVVINLHPSYNNGGLQNLYSGMNAKADREGFIAIHPDSIGPAWNVSPDLETEDGGVSDVEFVRLGLDELERHALVDPRRIYVTGYSSGGAMSGRLAVASARGELGTHKIAAIAPVSAPPWDGHGALDPTATFNCPEMATDPVPMRMIVSNNDKTLALIFKRSVSEVDEALRRIAREYARANGISSAPIVVRTWRTGWGVLTETDWYVNGQSRRDTLLDVFDTGGADRDGHVWPGPWFGGEYQTTDVIWSFFVGHPRS
ncbi:MAG TPA: PHB depolymerase family esterase [Planctomycetota bacterium]|nr:PHB depolymerase family esterase [Planctomycetota bacterium]